MIHRANAKTVRVAVNLSQRGSSKSRGERQFVPTEVRLRIKKVAAAINRRSE